MDRRRSDRIARLRPAALASAAVVIAGLWTTRSIWMPGRFLSAFDTYTYSGPNLAVTARAASSFELALWNGDIFGGAPHLGNPQAGTLYLPRLLAVAMDDNRALGLIVTAHVVFLGLGMLGLARRLGCTYLAAGFVGVVSVLSGAVATKAIQFEQILVLAWAPWLLLAVVSVMWSPRPRLAMAGLALTVGGTLTSGHPQIVYEVVILAGVVVVGLSTEAAPRRRLGALGIGVGLGAALALPQLVASLVATAESHIGAGRDTQALVDPSLVLHPTHLLRAFLGALGDRNPAVTAGNFESIEFIGVVVAALALVGVGAALADRDRRRWAVPLIAVGLLAMMWSLGPRSLAFRLATSAVPGFDLARGSVRWLLLITLGAVIFSGFGLDAVRTARHPRRDITVLIVGLGMAAVLVAFFEAGVERSIVIGWAMIASAALGLIFLALVGRDWIRLGALTALGLLAVAELMALGKHSVLEQTSAKTSYEDLARPTSVWLAGRAGFTISLADDLAPAVYSVPSLRPNANVLVGVRSIDGYDGGVQVTSRWADALRRHSADPVVDLPLRNNVAIPLDPQQLGRLGIRFVLIDNARPVEFVQGWLGPRIDDGAFSVWENPAWVGEAVAWSRAVAVAEGDAADLLRTGIDRWSDIALVEGDAPRLDCDGPASACAPRQLFIDRPRPEVLVVRTDVNNETIVTVDQQIAPGWGVTVDGRNAHLLEIDGLFMGVRVPAGPHEIRFTYQPGWLPPTLVAAALAAIATAALAVSGWRRRGGPSPESQSVTSRNPASAPSPSGSSDPATPDPRSDVG